MAPGTLSVEQPQGTEPVLHTDPIYRDLPYGIWTCADGRQVLFNRRYQPMWQRMPGEQASEANPDERIPFERQEWLYSDANRRGRARTPSPAAKPSLKPGACSKRRNISTPWTAGAWRIEQAR